MTILTHYILPAFMLLLVVGILVLKFGKDRGPFALAMIFLSIAFGPSLAYALITDESSSALFLGSLVMAFIITGTVLLLALRKRRPQTLVFVNKDDKRFGPYTTWDLGKKVANGEFSLDDLAWYEGMTDWQPLRAVLKLDENPALRSLLESTQNNTSRRHDH